MAFTGGWRDGARAQVDVGKVHTADPAHSDYAEVDGTEAESLTMPAMVDPGLILEYPGLEWVTETGGTFIDITDTRSHERNDADQGAAVAAYYNTPKIDFVDERRVTDRFDSPGAPDVNPVALQRGRNGLTVNNPDGFRAGVDESYFEYRKFPVGERVHESRVIFPDLPDTNDQGPAPLAAGQYPTAFAGLARIVTNVNQKPTDRREPPTMGGDLRDDGAPIYPAFTDDWVVG